MSLIGKEYILMDHTMAEAWAAVVGSFFVWNKFHEMFYGKIDSVSKVIFCFVNPSDCYFVVVSELMV
jgi:hypothetical protein